MSESVLKLNLAGTLWLQGVNTDRRQAHEEFVMKSSGLIRIQKDSETNQVSVYAEALDDGGWYLIYPLPSEGGDAVVTVPTSDIASKVARVLGAKAACLVESRAEVIGR